MKQTVILRNPDLKRRACALINGCEDGKYRVVIEPHVSDKTAEQRGFFHLLCELAAKEYHTQMWKVKEAVKQELWGYDVVTIGGKQRVVTRSSESANKLEYSDLIETLYQMAAQDGINLPPPLHGDERISA